MKLKNGKIIFGCCTVASFFLIQAIGTDIATGWLCIPTSLLFGAIGYATVDSMTGMDGRE